MTFKSYRLGLYRLRITRAQQDVHHICEGQTLGIGSIFNYKYVSGLANYALGKEETCCQLVVMSGRSHNHRQAPAVDTHFKRFFNSQLVFILLLLIFLPVGYTDVHHAFGIKRRTPEAWYRHLMFPSSLVVWYRPNRRQSGRGRWFNVAWQGIPWIEPWGGIAPAHGHMLFLHRSFPSC